MPIRTMTISVDTQGYGDVVDITEAVIQQVKASGIDNGSVIIFAKGSTGAITSIEYESGVVQDLKEAIQRMVPRNIPYHHDARWQDGNGYAHVSAALIGASCCVPFSNKTLCLGTWQQIVLINFDNRPRNRSVILQIIGE